MHTGRERWILALLVISAFINYVDARTCSSARPRSNPNEGSRNQLGLLLSAFFWTYALPQLGAIPLARGPLPHRLDLRGGIPLVVRRDGGHRHGYGLSRPVLHAPAIGAGESVSYPAYSRILASYPERRRGFANSVIDAGTRTGPVLGTLLGGLLMPRFETAGQIRKV